MNRMHAVLDVYLFLGLTDVLYFTKKIIYGKHKKQNQDIAIICQLLCPLNVHPIIQIQEETGLRAKAYSSWGGGEGSLTLTKKEKGDVISNITSQ